VFGSDCVKDDEGDGSGDGDGDDVLDAGSSDDMVGSDLIVYHSLTRVSERVID